MKRSIEGEQIFGLWIRWFCVSALVGFLQGFVGVCEGLDLCQLFSSVPVMKTTILDARGVLIKWILVFSYLLHLVWGQYVLVKSLEWMPLNHWVSQTLRETQRIFSAFFQMNAFLRFLDAFRGLETVVSVLVSRNVGLHFRAACIGVNLKLHPNPSQKFLEKVPMAIQITQHSLQKLQI
jgi:hypothetical protein